MCGRYRVSKRKQILEEHFDSPADFEEDWTPHYNIAPTQIVPVVRQHPKEPVRKLSLIRWGLIPQWSNDTSGAAKMINGRSEGVTSTTAFAQSFKLRRCLVPADGFYEWHRTGKVNQPYCFEVNDGGLFAFAGLWDRWKNPNGEWIKSFSILTTSPNRVTAPVHDRMPVILDPSNYDLWLDPGMQNIQELRALLKPLDADRMRSYPVSVNSVANDDDECSRPAAPVEIQSSLFQ